VLVAAPKLAQLEQEVRERGLLSESDTTDPKPAQALQRATAAYN
jgi:hypothetical protein